MGSLIHAKSPASSAQSKTPTWAVTCFDSLTRSSSSQLCSPSTSRRHRPCLAAWRAAASMPLISRSMSKIASIRFTASSAMSCTGLFLRSEPLKAPLVRAQWRAPTISALKQLLQRQHKNKRRMGGRKNSDALPGRATSGNNGSASGANSQ